MDSRTCSPPPRVTWIIAFLKANMRLTHPWIIAFLEVNMRLTHPARLGVGLPSLGSSRRSNMPLY